MSFLKGASAPFVCYVIVELIQKEYRTLDKLVYQEKRKRLLVEPLLFYSVGSFFSPSSVFFTISGLVSL